MEGLNNVADGAVQRRKRIDYKAKYFTMRGYAVIMAGIISLLLASIWFMVK